MSYPTQQRSKNISLDMGRTGMVLRFVEGLLKYRFLGTTKEFLLGRAGVGPNGHTLGIT